MIQRLCFLIIALGTSSFLSAQAHFPDRCLGEWEGMMYIYGKGQLRDSVKIEFTAAKTSEENTWTWRTKYLSETYPMTKDYQLILKDAATGTYVTDEKNSIELSDYLFENKLYSIFETQGILLTSSYELRAEELIFEVTSGKKSAEGTGHGVGLYSVDNVQRVVLKKKE